MQYGKTSSRTLRPDAKRPCIWAVGGGKGGVGKSIVASNLGVALAAGGRKCILVDADLGAANLHTLVGVGGPRRTLSHFLRREVPGLAQVITHTPIKNLYLVSGSRALLDIANLKHMQKQRLLRHLRALEIDDVVLDVSAGSAFNALDFFLEAERGILIATPEPTALENAYHFLKAAFFRSLSRAAAKSPVRAAIQAVLDQKGGSKPRSPKRLIAEVAEIDPVAGMELRARAKAFRPDLIVNKVQTAEQRMLGFRIAGECRNYLGTDVRYLGALERDDLVRESVRQRKPVTALYPASPFSRDLGAIVGSLLSDHRSGTPRATSPLRGAPPLSEPGAFLRFRRESLGLSLTELSRRTRICCLESLENENFTLLPSEISVRTFVREYARALGIEEPEVITEEYLRRYRGSAQIA